MKGKRQERERFLMVRDVESYLARPSKVLQTSMVAVFSRRLLAEECTEYGGNEYMALIQRLLLKVFCCVFQSK